MAIIPIVWNQLLQEVCDDLISTKPWTNCMSLYGKPYYKPCSTGCQCYITKKPIDKKWTFSVPVGDFNPEEIKVKVENDKVFINAKSTEGNEEWGDIVERNRTVKIPKGVDKEKIISFMKSDGTLVLEAPVVECDECKTKILTIEKQNEDEKEVISSEGKNDLMKIDIQNYNPEEVSVTCTDGVITAQGKRQRSENGHEIRESFYRKMTLPESVDQKNLQCFKDNDGHLIIKEIIITGDDKNQSGQ